MNDLTTKAVRLNDSLPAIWVLRSLALMFMGQWNAALQASAKGMRLEPYSCGLILQHAMLTILCGRPADAMTLVEQAIALDPSMDASSFVGEAQLLLGNYEAAVAACERAMAQGSDNFMLALSMAAAYAHLGDAANTATAKAEVLRAVPGYTIAVHRSRGYSANPDYLRLVEEHLYSGMRKAGFAED
jgi:tetratricopeptide (TPR) repeat protein